MSWLKKRFSSQSSAQSSSQSTSEEPKVYYSTQISTKTEEPKKETTDVTESEFEQCYGKTQSIQDSCYSWSGVSQSINIKGEKRGWSSDEEEEKPWWESLKSQSTKNSTQETSFHLSQPSISQQTEASHSQQENDDNAQEDESKKISFYLKLGKNKKFRFM